MAENTVSGGRGPYPLPEVGTVELRTDDVAQVAAELERRIEDLDRERAKLEEHRAELTVNIDDVSRRRDGLAAAREALGGYELARPRELRNEAGRG